MCVRNSHPTAPSAMGCSPHSKDMEGGRILLGYSRRTLPGGSLQTIGHRDLVPSPGMRHWLLKSEPEAYSWSDLVREQVGTWDGVRNYMARNHLRAMCKGDLALFYHSVSEKSVVGICTIVEEHSPDPTAEKGDWSVVRVSPVRALEHPVPLDTLRAESALREMSMFKYNRLSVCPLTEEEFAKIVEMGG